MISQLENNSLVIISAKKIIYKSDKNGLRPIIECAIEQKIKGNTIIDKVIGLAAARIIVLNSAKIVYCKTASLHAIELLNRAKIPVHAEQIVENILNQDKTSVCPMELLARDFNDNNEFFEAIKKKFNPC
jgi:hypothetical protein